MEQRHEDLPGDGLDRPGRGLGRRSWLLVVAAGETLTLAALLVNLLLTAHSGALAAALGPVHGALYLGGVLLTWSGTFPRVVKVVAVVPVAGAWVAVARSAHDLRAAGRGARRPDADGPGLSASPG